MNFAKIALGALVLAIGAILLLVPLRFAPPETPVFLFRYWPVLLIAFGLAFLASVIKNRFLGCLAVLLILGGAAVGIFWVKQHHRPGKARGVSSMDLGRARVSSLAVRVHTFAGRLEMEAAPSRSRALSIGVSGLPGDSAVGYRFGLSGKKAVLEWPQVVGGFGIPPPGATVRIRVPEALPLALDWRGQFASMRADLARLRITRCDLHEIASSSRMDLGDGGRPEEIRIGGFLSNVTIRIPADCPIQLVSRSPLVLRNLPYDFVEQAKGRGKDRVDLAEGRGRPVRIIVDGPLIRIAIERTPSVKGLVKEDSEWPEVEGTASRSRSL